MTLADHDDPRWLRLRELITQHSLLKGDFTLTSGRKSSYLFQLRQTTMLPEGQNLLGHLILDEMAKRKLTCIGGPVHGAVPIVVAASTVSYPAGRPVHAFFVRKEPKAHGAKEQLDGYCPEGAHVLMVDDVTTTGGSVIQAVEHVRAERRAEVNWVLSVTDREEGASENLAKHGLSLIALFKKSDFEI